MNRASKSFKIICNCFQRRWKHQFSLILCLFCTTIWRDFMEVIKKTKKPEIQETEFTYSVPTELKTTFIWKYLFLSFCKNYPKASTDFSGACMKHRPELGNYVLPWTSQSKCEEKILSQKKSLPTECSHTHCAAVSSGHWGRRDG